ncbi:MAG: hypothetical protein KTR28_05905 [Micavibrio sp.]|nr:hypothetical protein [Micavibrio sp.]
MLDHIFTHIAINHLASPPDYASDESMNRMNWLVLGFKAQAQCTKSISSKASAKYMGTLSHINKLAAMNMPFYERDADYGLICPSTPPVFDFEKGE